MIKTYGHRTPGKCRSETAEQITCMSWLECHYPDRFGLVFHPANEVTVDKRKPGWAMHLEKRRRMGVKKGVADIIDLYGTDVWRAGVFELKALNGKPTDEQLEFLEAAAARGSFAAICYGADAFKEAWQEYLTGRACGRDDGLL